MISGGAKYTLTRLKSLYGLLMTYVPLCAYHAFSLADSHIGHLKSKLVRLLLRSAYPQDMKAWIEANFRRATCFVLDFIDRKALNSFVYPHLNSAGISGVRSWGEIEILAMCRARTLVGIPDTWKGKDSDLIPGVPAPGWRPVDLRDSKHPDVNGRRRCLKCSLATGVIVFMGGRGAPPAMPTSCARAWTRPACRRRSSPSRSTLHGHHQRAMKVRNLRFMS